MSVYCLRWLMSVALCVALAGCGQRLQRDLHASNESHKLSNKSKWLKAHMKNGDVYVLTRWRVVGGHTIHGRGTRYDMSRRPTEKGELEVRVADVALFETNVEKTSSATTGMVALTIASAATTLACLTNPKACFGSCPTFYITDGTRMTLQAEAFSSSIAPSLEANDLDALYAARPETRRVELRVTNEALETHVLRQVDLLAVTRPPGGRVFGTEDGRFFGATDIRPPERCSAAEGDCLAAVTAFDQEQRGSRSDGENLATRELVELQMSVPPGERLGFVIGARQTFLTTFLFYQALAYMGRDVGRYMAMLERGDETLDRQMRGIHQLLGPIEVQVRDGSGWRTVGSFDETGPIATDVKVVALPPGVDARRIRLRMTRGHWRLDYLALARLDGELAATRLRPVAVRSKTPAIARRVRAALWDPHQTVVTMPGDAHTLVYELPGDPADTELFLDARGYYLEWMRDEWLKEENPLGVAMMLFFPERALRMLAPRFHAMEPRMEELFWRSRYVAP